MDQAGTHFIPPTIHQTNQMKPAGRSYSEVDNAGRLIGCAAKDAHLSTSAWQGNTDPSLTCVCVSVCVVKATTITTTEAVWLRSPWLQRMQLRGLVLIKELITCRGDIFHLWLTRSSTSRQPRGRAAVFTVREGKNQMLFIQ